MLVSILGSPSSGKTTTAAMAFALLKEQGLTVEFIPEQARFYIAEKRHEALLEGRPPIILDDSDQVAIMEKQLHAERIMKSACAGKSIVLTDSSPLNAILYMSDETVEEERVGLHAEEAIRLADLVFYSAPLPSFAADDPNRLHDEQQSKVLDEKIPWLCERYQLLLSGVLDGNPQQRMQTLVNAVVKKWLAS